MIKLLINKPILHKIVVHTPIITPYVPPHAYVYNRDPRLMNCFHWTIFVPNITLKMYHIQHHGTASFHYAFQSTVFPSLTFKCTKLDICIITLFLSLDYNAEKIQSLFPNGVPHPQIPFPTFNTRVFFLYSIRKDGICNSYMRLSVFKDLGKFHDFCLKVGVRGQILLSSPGITGWSALIVYNLLP